MMVAAGNDNLFRRLAAAHRPAEPRRGPALSHATGDRVVHRAELVPILADIFATPSGARIGPGCSTRPASRTARSTRSTRSSPTRRPQALGHDPAPSRAATSAWSACRCRSTASARPSPSARRRSAKTTPPCWAERRCPSRPRLCRRRPRSPRSPRARAAAASAVARAGAGRAPDTAITVRSSRMAGSSPSSGPKTQHAAPFLGVPGTNYLLPAQLLDTRSGEIANQLYVEDSYVGAAARVERRRRTRPARRCALSRSATTRSPATAAAPMPRNSPPHCPMRCCARARWADGCLYRQVGRADDDPGSGSADRGAARRGRLRQGRTRQADGGGAAGGKIASRKSARQSSASCARSVNQAQSVCAPRTIHQVRSHPPIREEVMRST